MNKFLLNRELYKYSNLVEKPIRLKNLLKYDLNSVKNTNNLKLGFKDDLLIRLAKRSVELENLPYGLSVMPSISELTKCYINSFRDLHQFKNLSDDQELVNILTKIYDRHADTSNKITEGLKQLNDEFTNRYEEDIFDYLKKNGHLPFGSFDKLNNSIDQFYTNRFSVRLLIDQYINYENNKENFVGVINTQTSPLEILEDAVEDSLDLSKYNYSDYPEIRINAISNPKLNYIPSHLYYVFFEIIKNSIRATMENKGEPIDIVLSGEKDIIIKISDKGNGIKYSELDRIWYYSYTSVENNYYNSKIDLKNAPLAGLGFGLPVSRATIKFLGGDIKLMSVENYGTDVFITLPGEK